MPNASQGVLKNSWAPFTFFFFTKESKCLAVGFRSCQALIIEDGLAETWLLWPEDPGAK